MAKIPRSVKVEAENHTQKAYLGIRQMLFHKEIVPGQKIGYRDLSERLGMSPTPVIQALKWLEFQGLVRHEPNRGYYVEPIDLQEIEEIYELRELLEISLLPDAIKNLDNQGLQRLRQALKAHQQAERELYLNERILRDADFHLTLASLAKKGVQERVLRLVLDLLCLKYRGGFLSATTIETTDTEHQELFEAVAGRDLPRAQEILRRHINNVKSRVVANFKRMLEEKEESGLVSALMRRGI